MKLKTSKINDFCVVVIFLLLAGYSCFNMIDIAGLTHGDFRITFIIGALLTVVLLRKNQFGWRGISKRFRMYFWCTFVSILILAIYTVLAYPKQSLQLTFRYVCQYLLVIWTIPIYYKMRRDQTTEKMLHIVLYVALIWSVLILLESGYYATTGGILLNFIHESSSGLREGNLRISIGCFTNFAIIYSFWKIYNCSEKRKILYLVAFVLMMMANILVFQSRASLVTIGVTLCVMAFFDENRGYRIIRKIIIVLVIGGVCFMTDMIQSYFTDIFTKYSVSVTARSYALDYYWGGVFLKNPLVGFGLLKDQINYSSVYSGPLGLAFTDDVGFVGQLAILGIFSIPIIIGAYYHLILLYRKVTRLTGKRNILMLGSIVYLLSTSLTLIVFDQGRICLLPVLMAMFEYFAWKSEEKPSCIIEN